MLEKHYLHVMMSGPTIMMIVNMVLDPAAGPVAIGRLFSGTIKDGQTIQIIDEKREGRVQSVNFFMGNQREQVGELGLETFLHC